MVSKWKSRFVWILLSGLALLPAGFITLLFVFAEPNSEIRLGDVLVGSTRLRFRELDLSAEPRLSPVQFLIAEGHVCDAMLVKGLYDHHTVAAVHTPDHCQQFKDTLAANQIDCMESEWGQDFGLDSNCSREISNSCTIFSGNFDVHRHQYRANGRFDEQSGWVLISARRIGPSQR